jgi:hypothetical protein
LMTKTLYDRSGIPLFYNVGRIERSTNLKLSV